MPLSPLPASFYDRSQHIRSGHDDSRCAGAEQDGSAVLDVARDLLGSRLVRRLAGPTEQPAVELVGYIVETEAYQGESDLACHARAGRTARTAVMYGPPGRAYVYFIYGMHWMLNCVTGPPGLPEAVLVRALLPVKGLQAMAHRRGINPASRQPPAVWTNGPARLCQALGIDGRLNGADLTDPLGELVIEAGLPVSPGMITAGPRVGIERVPEPWRSQPWRFRLQNWQAPTEEDAA
jgi:DNA-3-methyladenine glycosylase